MFAHLKSLHLGAYDEYQLRHPSKWIEFLQPLQTYRGLKLTQSDTDPDDFVLEKVSADDD
eukprot:5651424-Pleurochrysis_carterae.AAC.1